MTGLGKLIAMQKAKTNDSKDNAAGKSVQDAPVDSRKDSSGPGAEHASESKPVKSEPAAAPAAPAKMAGLNFLGRAGNSGPANSGGVAKAPAKRPAAPSPAPSDSKLGADGLTGFTLDDIAGLDASETPIEEAGSISSGFLDEIEATAPDRNLPAELGPQQLAFVESLDGIYSVLHDPDFFAGSIRSIMSELQENKEYIKLVSDQDIHTMIHGMRNIMGLAVIKKTEKKKPAARGKKARVDDDTMALLDSLGGSFD